MAVAVMVSPVLTFWSLLINTKLSPGSNRNSSLPPTTLNWIKSPRSLWSAAKSISPSVAFVWNVTSMVFSSLLNEMLLCSKNEPCLKPGKWRSPVSEKNLKNRICEIHDLYETVKSLIHCRNIWKVWMHKEQKSYQGTQSRQRQVSVIDSG